MYPNYNPNFNPNFNPNYNQGYYPQTQQIHQQQVQTIQPQANTYFVRSIADLNGLNVMPNNYYVGINQDKKEIYVRRMNNDGNIEVETYALLSEKKEKTDLQAIFDRLDEIEKKITQRQPQSMKGKDNERTTRTDNE